MPIVRQLVEVEFSATLTTVRRTDCRGSSGLGSSGVAVALAGSKLEQMPLAFSLHDLRGSPAIDPSLQGIQFIDRGLMRRLQRSYEAAVSSSTRLSSDACSKSRQQELVALGQVGGKRVGVIHNAHCFTDFCNA